MNKKIRTLEERLVQMEDEIDSSNLTREELSDKRWAAIEVRQELRSRKAMFNLLMRRLFRTPAYTGGIYDGRYPIEYAVRNRVNDKLLHHDGKAYYWDNTGWECYFGTEEHAIDAALEIGTTEDLWACDPGGAYIEPRPCADFTLDDVEVLNFSHNDGAWEIAFPTGLFRREEDASEQSRKLRALFQR